MFLKDAGSLMVDRILQFYQLPRVERITNNTNAAEYFKFHITERKTRRAAAQAAGAACRNKIAVTFRRWSRTESGKGAGCRARRLRFRLSQSST
jgi:hypothetical protein